MSLRIVFSESGRAFMSWSHHCSPAFSLLCVLCFPVSIIPHVSLPLSVLCMCMCMWVWFSSTGNARWIHFSNQPPIKPLDSLLLIARSFHQYTWLFASWLFYVFWTSVPVDELVWLMPLCFFHFASDCRANLVASCLLLRVCYFPACLMICLPAACSLVFPGLSEYTREDGPHCVVPQHHHYPAADATSQYLQPCPPWWPHEPRWDPGTSQPPFPSCTRFHIWTLKDMLFTVTCGFESCFEVRSSAFHNNFSLKHTEALGETQTSLGTNLFGMFSCVESFWNRVQFNLWSLTMLAIGHLSYWIL